MKEKTSFRLPQALQMMVSQDCRQGLLTLAETGGSPAASSRGSPELAASREGLPTHRLLGVAGAAYRSPARSLAISIPDAAAGYKEGAHCAVCVLGCSR